MTNSQLRRIGRRIRESDEVVLHAGPGILTESELPATALAEAVWGSPDGRFNSDRFETEPESLWADWLEFWEDVATDPVSVSPRPVHERIEELIECEHVSAVITENVFGLLRDAGVPSDRCVEFHGRIDEARCVNCARTYDVSPARSTGNRRYPTCGRTLAPGIVLAEEPPRKADRLQAWSRAEKCDLYVAVGTQLTVHPTDENARHAVETGADLAIIADRPTTLDDDADDRLWSDPASGLGKLRDMIAVFGD